MDHERLRRITNPRVDELEAVGAELLTDHEYNLDAYFTWLALMIEKGNYLGGERFEDGRLVYRGNPARRG